MRGAGATTDQPSAARGLLPSLTSLRFFAAFGVAAWHLTAAYPPPSIGTFMIHATWGGTTGVSFFFILSGFVLTWSATDPLLRHEFYRRRWARVFPTHALTWAIAVLIGLWLGFFWGSDAWDNLAALALVQAWFPTNETVFAGNAVSWTLSCEAFFYALFPALLPALLRASSPGRRALLALCFVTPAAIALSLWVLDGNVLLVACFPLARLPEFIAGMLLALRAREGAWLHLDVRLAALASVAAYAAVSVEPNLWTTAAVTIVPYSALIITVARHDVEGRSWWLSKRTLVHLGMWSFALYLVHPLVISLLTKVVGRDPVGGTSSLWIGGLALSIAAAAAVHLLWEAPLERRLRGSSPPRAELSAVG